MKTLLSLLLVFGLTTALPLSNNESCTDCEILQVLEEIAEHTKEFAHKQPVPLYSSCEDIRQMWPMSKSGYYQIIKPDKKTLEYTYCNMDHPCGSEGWIKVATLDMTNPEESCPSELVMHSDDAVRACGRQTSDSGGCSSIVHSTRGISYSEVCGRVIGYQYGTTDAIDSKVGGGHYDIDSHYVDGISVTHGSSPRKHIWTFMAGVTEAMSGMGSCPCNDGSSVEVQEFIGEDYFCESGNTRNSYMVKLYGDDRLWDGESCGNNEIECCAAPAPWFHKKLNYYTSDNIELRICCDQPTRYEDVPIEQYEIFVR